jgi:hypothetical protein
MKPFTGLVLAAALAATACEDNSIVQGDLCRTPGFRCDTPACAQFPNTPGCNSAPPVGDHCPSGQSYCFDPSNTMGYCNPTTSVCAQPRSPMPMNCPSRLCSAADVAVCNDVQSDHVFCPSGYACRKFDDCSDGGASDGGASDGGVSDASAPVDLPGDF